MVTMQNAGHNLPSLPRVQPKPPKTDLAAQVYAALARAERRMQER